MKNAPRPFRNYSQRLSSAVYLLCIEQLSMENLSRVRKHDFRPEIFRPNFRVRIRPQPEIFNGNTNKTSRCNDNSSFSSKVPSHCKINSTSRVNTVTSSQVTTTRSTHGARKVRTSNREFFAKFSQNIMKKCFKAVQKLFRTHFLSSLPSLNRIAVQGGTSHVYESMTSGRKFFGQIFAKVYQNSSKMCQQHFLISFCECLFEQETKLSERQTGNAKFEASFC